MSDLATVTVTGSRNLQPVDFASSGIRRRREEDDRDYSPPGDVQEAFAPFPLDAPLPELVVGASRAAPVIAPGSVAGALLGSAAGVIGGLLLPSPIGREPDVTELEPVFPLPELVITAPPPREPPREVISSPAASDFPSFEPTLGWRDYSRFIGEEILIQAGKLIRRETLGDITDAFLRFTRSPDVREPGRVSESGPARVGDQLGSAPSLGVGRVVPVDEFDTITVAAPRSEEPVPVGRDSPAIRDLPVEIVGPGSFAVPGPFPVPRWSPEPVAVPRATPTETPTRTPFVPLEPFQPSLPPSLFAAPRSVPRPPPRLAPDRPPTLDPLRFAEPLKARPNNCPPCVKAEEKKPKKRRKKARKMCTRGVYTTSRKGISHSVLERFPCP